LPIRIVTIPEEEKHQEKRKEWKLQSIFIPSGGNDNDEERKRITGEQSK